MKSPLKRPSAVSRPVVRTTSPRAKLGNLLPPAVSETPVERLRREGVERRLALALEAEPGAVDKHVEVAPPGAQFPQRLAPVDFSAVDPRRPRVDLCADAPAEVARVEQARGCGWHPVDPTVRVGRREAIPGRQCGGFLVRAQPRRTWGTMTEQLNLGETIDVSQQVGSESPPNHLEQKRAKKAGARLLAGRSWWPRENPGAKRRILSPPPSKELPALPACFRLPTPRGACLHRFNPSTP